MMVLNAIYSQPDLYNTLIYGIEGEDYTKNADGTITIPEVLRPYMGGLEKIEPVA